MIQGKVKGELAFPRLELQKDLVHIADRIFIPYMVEAMDGQRSIDGSNYPDLDPKTWKYKKTKMILRETGKLRKSFRSRKVGINTVKINLDSSNNRDEIGKYLQIDGVGKSKKKFVFFGVSSEMEKRAIDYVDLTIRKAIKDGKDKTVIR